MANRPIKTAGILGYGTPLLIRSFGISVIGIDNADKV